MLIGHALWGAPSDPDVGIPPLRLLGAAFIFLFFAHAAWSWGEWLRFRWVDTQDDRWSWGAGVLSLGLGLCFLIAAIGLLGHLGAVRFGSAGIGIMILALGPCLLAVHSTGRSRRAEPTPRHGLSTAVLVLTMALVVSDRMLRATLIQGHTDPHMAHLLAARYWLQTGSMSIPAFQPGAASAWYWEHLYLWGQWLLGGPDGGGVLEGQIFAQWTHVLFGYLGSLAALRHLGALLGLDAVSAWALALVGAGSRGLQDVIFFAKNDWGAIFFSLTLLVTGLDPDRSRGAVRAVVLGLLSGAAVGVKMNTIPYVAASLVLLHSRPLRLRELGISCLVAFVALVPLFVRNWIAVGDPLTFALGGRLGIEAWGPSMGAIVKRHTGSWSLDPAVWLSQFRTLLADNPLNLLAPVISVLALVLRGFRCLLAPVGIGWIGLLPFLPRRISVLIPRWFGLGLVLLPSLVAAGLLKAAQGIPLLRKSWIWLVAALAYYGNFTHSQSIQDIVNTGTGLLAVRQADIILGGEAKAWIRLNLPKEAPVVTTGDNLLYLVLHHNIRSSRDDPALISALFKVTDPRRVLWVFARQGMRYVLDTVHWDSYYWTYASHAVHVLAREHPEAIVFAGKASMVIDLEALLPHYFPSCFERGPWVRLDVGSS